MLLSQRVLMLRNLDSVVGQRRLSCTSKQYDRYEDELLPGCCRIVQPFGQNVFDTSSLLCEIYLEKKLCGIISQRT